MNDTKHRLVRSHMVGRVTILRHAGGRGVENYLIMVEPPKSYKGTYWKTDISNKGGAWRILRSTPLPSPLLQPSGLKYYVCITMHYGAGFDTARACISCNYDWQNATHWFETNFFALQPTRTFQWVKKVLVTMKIMKLQRDLKIQFQSWFKTIRTTK